MENKWKKLLKLFTSRANPPKEKSVKSPGSGGAKPKKAPICSGSLVIPPGTEEIRRREYEGEDSLVRVTVPGSVKTIGERAFADCKNLKEVILQEGVSCICHNVFTGCESLESVKLPGSVTDIEGWAFYGSGLKEAVFSASGDRLIFCPKEAAKSRYAVPEGVREIGVQAFIHLPELKSVTLPEGLEVIRNRAFIQCGITEITLPDSVKTVETTAFSGCENLADIKRRNETDLVRARLDSLRVRGYAFLAPREVKLPEKKHWEDPEFGKLARECSLGKTEAMEEMADYFSRKAELEPQAIFYRAAFWFWIYRAYEWGSKKAWEYLEGWFKEHGEDQSVLSAYLSANLRGSGDGTALRALGFFFFKEETYYNLGGKDGDGVVEVCTWVDEDGPDEDGFGREEYYDYWYLDDCLNLPPRGKCLHSYSSLDRRQDGIKERFQKEHDIAAKAVKGRGLPEGFPTQS